MAINGELDRWAKIFPDTLVPQIIHLILDSWKDFKTNQSREVLITQAFFVVLGRNQELSKLPFLIDLEITLLNEDGTKQLGRVDLRFIHGYRQKVYLSFECKRLRVKQAEYIESLAGKYVTEGMGRYFNGQYAVGLDKGGMIGYVMEGKTNQAIQDVKKAVEKRRESLYMESDGTLEDSGVVKSKQVKETCHNYGPDGQFLMHHIFLPVENKYD